MRRGPLKGNARRTLFTWSAPRMAPLVIVGRAARSALLSNIFCWIFEGEVEGIGCK